MPETGLLAAELGQGLTVAYMASLLQFVRMLRSGATEASLDVYDDR